jgi:4-hydroxybenzoate polyprenyltransferase
MMSLNHYYREIKIYLKVARVDHWFKNVFMLVGAIAAIAYSKVPIGKSIILYTSVAFFLTCLMSSVNYIINEIVDARFDRIHPNKKLRPVASGEVSIRKLVFFVIVLLFFITSISYLTLNERFFSLIILFFIIGGVIYNIPPIRTKDLPYIDIISESLNNPVRLMLGWYSLNNISSIPLVGVLCYWSLGASIVTAKRIAEIKFLGDNSLSYRPTFKFYTNSLLTVIYFFFVLMTLTSFIAISYNYKYPLFYFIPFLIIFFIWFTFLTFQQNSIVKEPERLFEKKAFVTYCVFILFIFSFFVFK